MLHYNFDILSVLFLLGEAAANHKDNRLLSLKAIETDAVAAEVKYMYQKLCRKLYVDAAQRWPIINYYQIHHNRA